MTLCSGYKDDARRSSLLFLPCGQVTIYFMHESSGFCLSCVWQDMICAVAAFLFCIQHFVAWLERCL